MAGLEPHRSAIYLVQFTTSRIAPVRAMSIILEIVFYQVFILFSFYRCMTLKYCLKIVISGSTKLNSTQILKRIRYKPLVLHSSK